MYKFGVFGNPIAHSKSPEIHQVFANQLGVELDYQKILAPKDKFTNTLDDFITSGGQGCNITVPFKNQAYQVCHQLTKNAQLAGAVNTIKQTDAGYLGENTDGNGLVNDLLYNLNLDIKNKVVLILGAGGASQGILYPLLQQLPERVMIANRTKSKALDLATQFKEYGKTCGFGLDKIKNEPVDFIINATSASLAGEEIVLPNKLAYGAVCYDLIYGSSTPFMQWAEKNNACQVVDGWGMLVEQAALSFEFWTKKKPNTTLLIKNRL